MPGGGNAKTARIAPMQHRRHQVGPQPTYTAVMPDELEPSLPLVGFGSKLTVDRVPPWFSYAHREASVRAIPLPRVERLCPETAPESARDPTQSKSHSPATTTRSNRGFELSPRVRSSKIVMRNPLRRLHPLHRNPQTCLHRKKW